MAGDKEQRQSQGTERERELAELFARYVDRLNQGEKLDPERILADHPALGQELLECLEGYVDYPREGGSDEPLGTLGDYTLRREIGRGGMGIVYDAWQNSMDRRVALKVLPAAVAADNKSFTRFMREARTAGQLNHPNIVAVHAMGVDQKTPYYAMEFVDGETLADILERLEAEGEQDASDASVRISRLFIRSEKRTGGDKISVDGKRTGSEKRTGGKKSTGVAVGTAAGALTEAVRSAEQAVRSGAAAEAEAILEAGAEADADAAAVAAAAAAASPTRAAPGKEARETIGYASLANAFAGVADGLHHAHSRGVVHRDIKPSNLILDHGSDAGGASHVRVRILDFGLARLEGQEKLTASGEFLGTPLYVSPEQAQARKIPVDHRTDVYSLGTTMYELLTLRPPFKGRDYQDTLSQIISKDPSAPRGFNPRVPRDLETIVLKCLRKAPQDRYGTAEALAQDLRRFARGEPIEAQPQPAWEKLARRAWRSRARLALASLALLLAVVSAAFAYREWRAQNDAWTREYSEKVLGAVARLEMALSLPETPKSGSWGRFVRTMAVGGIPAEWYAPPTHESVRSSPSVQSAVAPLEEAAKLLPARPEAHYYLARARRILKQKAEAREALTLALESDGDFLPAVALEADILEEEGRKEEARRTRERLEETQGSEWSGPWLDAWRAQRDGEWPRAIGAFERLLDLESSGFERYLGFSLAVRLGCGRARLSAGDFRGALEDFASARALWPGLAAPQILSAKALFLMGDRSGAEERLRKLAARAGGQDDLFLRIGEILLDLGEYEAALG